MTFPFFSRYHVLLLGVLFVIFLGTLFLTFWERHPIYLAQSAIYNGSSLPTLKDKSSFPVLSAQGVYAYDLDSGVLLYEKNPNELLFPASTTKIVTALVALENYELDQILNTGRVSVSGSKMGLVWHEDISVNELLYGLLVLSANDAAEVLANNYPGGRTEFVKQMNLMADSLRAQNTRFLNPSGLDEAGQMTTARDLAHIASRAMLVPQFAKIVGTKSYIARSSDGNFVHPLVNRNELLGDVPGVLGVKTGWTEGARENLVSLVKRDGKRVMIAVLGSQDRFGESKELIEWIFKNYEWKDLNFYSEASP